MVAMYGMSDVIGLAHCAQPQNPMLARGNEDGTWQRDCSEQTAREIDQEVKKLLAEASSEAKHPLRDHRRQLDLVVGELLERETLDGKSFERLLRQADPPPIAQSKADTQDDRNEIEQEDYYGNSTY